MSITVLQLLGLDHHITDKQREDYYKILELSNMKSLYEAKLNGYYCRDICHICDIEIRKEIRKINTTIARLKNKLNVEIPQKSHWDSIV